VKLTIDPRNAQCMINFQAKVIEAYDYFNNPQGFEPEVIQAHIKHLTDRLKKESTANETFVTKVNALASQRPHNTMEDFFVNCTREFNSIRSALGQLQEYGFEVSTVPTKPYGTDAKAKSHKPSGDHRPSGSKQPSASTTPNGCRGCGRNHGGGAKRCVFRNHPDWNTEHQTKTWSESDKGKAWAARSLPQFELPHNMTLSGQRYDPPDIPKSSKPKQGKDDFDIIASMLTTKILNELVPMQLTSATTSIPIMSLIDTGAIQANYLSEEVAKRLKVNPKGQETIVSSGMNRVGSLKSKGSCDVTLSYFNELSKSTETIDIVTNILDILFDLIIGKPTLKEHKILQKVHDQFWGTGDETAIEEKPLHTGLAVTTHESLWSNQLVATILEEDQTKSWDNNDANDFLRSDSYPQPLDPLGDPKESTPTIPTDIHGDIDMTERLIALCHRFEDIFARDVRPTPADMPPFEIDVDMMKWHKSCNRAPPRPMTIAKQLELKKQLDKLVKLKVIERSEAPYYSQVLLVPKPFNKWRFCLDYRKLNEATEYTSAWPLPNI
jgi:hypothetical protein